jgi:hypothetical protein
VPEHQNAGQTSPPFDPRVVQADLLAERDRADGVAQALVGEGMELARQLVESEGCTLRVARRDGESYPLTLDFRPNRINVDVEAGVIVGVRASG